MEKKRELTLVPVAEVPNTYKRTKLQRLLEEFVAKDIAAARVDGSDAYHGLAGNLNRCAARFSLPVKAITQRGTVYLLRVKPDEQ